MAEAHEARRTALVQIPLVDALDEVDADADALLRSHGLDRGKIRDVSLRLPTSTVNGVFVDAEATTADPTLGIRAGLSLRRGVLDVFDYAVRSAATLRDAWTTAAQFDGLLDDTSKRVLRVEGVRACIEYHREPGEPDGFGEFALAGIGTVARQMTGDFLTADRVRLRRRPVSREDSAAFTALLGQETRLEFGAGVDTLEFPASYLDLPLRSGEPDLHRILERHAAELLARLPRIESLGGQVREQVLGELRGGNPGMTFIAEKLHMSARTLRRRLAEEGTTSTVTTST